MARFIGGVKGAKGAVTRLGLATTGLTAYAQGRNCGVSVSAVVSPEGEESFIVSMNGGSNGAQSTRVLGIVKGGVFTPEVVK